MSKNWNIALTLGMTLVITVLLLNVRSVTDQWDITVSNGDFINDQFKYQVALMSITMLSLIVTYRMSPQRFSNYLGIGAPAAPAHALKIFGIKEGESWKGAGVSLSIVITLVTAVFMYVQLNRVNVDWTILPGAFGWVLLFSLTNSFGEEMIYRVGIVSPLAHDIPANRIYLISAVIFGLAHVAGMPNGIIGMSMAAVLGYVLAKSVFETRGIFWAWSIHFLQDVIIIASLFLLSTAVE